MCFIDASRSATILPRLPSNSLNAFIISRSIVFRRCGNTLDFAVASSKSLDIWVGELQTKRRAFIVCFGPIMVNAVLRPSTWIIPVDALKPIAPNVRPKRIRRRVPSRNCLLSLACPILAMSFNQGLNSEYSCTPTRFPMASRTSGSLTRRLTWRTASKCVM